MSAQQKTPGYSTVLYANEEGSTFDMDYYLSTHMLLCGKIWGLHGLQSWQVIQFTTHPDGSKPPYKVQAILCWDDLNSLNTILGEHSKPIFDDVCQFKEQGTATKSKRA